MMRVWCFICIVLLLISSAFAQPVVPREMIIDTDVGIDDAIAILYLLKHPNIKVTAITIEGDGNAHCQPAFNNIEGLLALVNQANIPSACGRATPLSGQHQFPSFILTASDTFAGTPLQKSHVSLPHESAKMLMADTLNKAKQPIDILAIGPLTTIAEVLTNFPELRKKIHRIYIMGGAIYMPGNISDAISTSTNHVAEWNIYIDPLAAQRVFLSGVPITLVPLDVTNKVTVNQHFYHAFQVNHKTPAAYFIYDLLSHNKKFLHSHTWHFWDPMAAVIANDEKIATCKPMRLSVRLAPEGQSGRTAIDEIRGAAIKVCMDINSQQFEQELTQQLMSA